MVKVKILGTGLTGLVGSRITEILKDIYEFENLSLSTGVDITKTEQVFEKLKDSDASIILHLAAKTNVDGCEGDKIYNENGEAWKVNVLGTRNIVEACKYSNKKLIYVSTDFVFDGEKEYYDEDDVPNPINWYGKTKYEGEKIVQESLNNWVIMRLAYPYRTFFSKNDFARAMIIGLKNKEKIYAVEDHIMSPTFIDDLALAIDSLIRNNQEGIFHTVGSGFVSPYEAACLIAELFKFNLSLISKTTREVYFKNKAQRPFRLQLKNDKITKLGVNMRGFKEGLQEIKKQSIF